MSQYTRAITNELPRCALQDIVVTTLIKVLQKAYAKVEAQISTARKEIAKHIKSPPQLPDGTREIRTQIINLRKRPNPEENYDSDDEDESPDAPAHNDSVQPGFK